MNKLLTKIGLSYHFLKPGISLSGKSDFNTLLQFRRCIKNLVQCKKKVILNGEIHTCNEHGRIVPERRALLSIILDDGTENLRAIAFSENIEKLGINTKELESSFVIQRETLLGKELVFSGNVRQNKIFNNTEFIITDAKDLELDSLIKELETSNS